MSLLNLDITINTYLEIINKNILEPYLRSTDWAAIEGTGGYVATVTATFDSGPNTIRSGTGADDVLKTKQSGSETEDYFKINQESSSGKAAVITNTLNTDLDGSTGKSIDSTNLADNFNTDSDGLIYYTNTTVTPNVKIYNLSTSSSFQDAVASGSADPTSLTDHAYYDYFVRFKVLKYIKNNYLDINVSNLKETITGKLTTGSNSITDLENTVGTSGNLIIKMLDFLEFINIKNNDKFEATVNCLYYYYYIALLEYNTIFCSKNLEYFSKDTTIINAELIKLKPTQLNSDTVSSYEYKTSNDTDLILSSLIAIFESLIGADNNTGEIFEDSLITRIFVQEEGKNTKLYKLITKLLKLHYDVGDSSDPKKIKLYQIASTSATSGKNMEDTNVAFTDNSSSVSVNGATATSIKYQLRLRQTENIVSSGTEYTLKPAQLVAIELLPVGGTIDTFINAYKNTLAGDKSIFDYSSAIADIKDLYDFLIDLSPDKQAFDKLYKDALEDDSRKGHIPNTIYDDQSKIKYNNANTKLAAIKPVLEKILEHYEKAKKLNEILGNINDAYDSIEETTKADTIQDENIAINDTLVDITKADNSYKENVDKYKTKNNELNNILKNNLYNNIFLYITIVVLILICLGLIYINNHKASLKTQYSVMLIAFLLLYYIIYTNVTVNITETFQVDNIKLKSRKLRNDFTTLISSVHMYLYSLTTASKAYKESLKKEKNKYDGFAKSSNSKLNSLELVLNDEFINAIKSKELVKFLILFTAICIISYIVYTNTEDPTTTSIIFIILFVIILAIYFYNINLMTRTKADTKYWNHRMVMK